MDFKINSVYSFETNGVPTVPVVIKNAKLLMQMNAAEAAKIADIYTYHQSALGNLPPGTPGDVSSMTFYKFLTETNAVLVLADAWIKQNTVQLVDTKTLTVSIPGITSSDRAIILDLLNARGYRVSSSVLT